MKQSHNIINDDEHVIPQTPKLIHIIWMKCSPITFFNTAPECVSFLFPVINIFILKLFGHYININIHLVFIVLHILVEKNHIGTTLICFKNVWWSKRPTTLQVMPVIEAYLPNTRDHQMVSEVRKTFHGLHVLRFPSTSTTTLYGNIIRNSMRFPHSKHLNHWNHQITQTIDNYSKHDIVVRLLLVATITTIGETITVPWCKEMREFGGFKIRHEVVPVWCSCFNGGYVPKLYQVIASLSFPIHAFIFKKLTPHFYYLHDFNGFSIILNDITANNQGTPAFKSSRVLSDCLNVVFYANIFHSILNL